MESLNVLKTLLKHKDEMRKLFFLKTKLKTNQNNEKKKQQNKTKKIQENKTNSLKTK